MNRPPPPKIAPDCRRCSKPMYKTHSRWDYACFDCGDQISYHTSAEGVYKEPVFLKKTGKQPPKKTTP